jgi:hypothetical protein
MNVSSLSSIYSHFIQPVLSSTFGVGSSAATASAGSSPAAGDSKQLSPFAQIATTLQQLQQQSSTQYQSVTGKIAANLQTAAGAAQGAGNTTLANQLSQLSSDFSSASQNNQLPDFHDLAQVIAGGHNHRHGEASASTSGGGNSSAGSGGADAASLLSQFSAGGQNQALNPVSIVFSTLSSAGISLG